MRHGDALASGGSAATDAERPLSERGEDDVRRAGKALARLDPGVMLVLTSPALRAVETARLIALSFPSPPEVRTSDRLKSGTRVDAMLQEIIGTGKESVVAVGHQPDLGTLLAWLIADGGPASLVLPPGTIAGLELQPDPGNPGATLRWILPPDLTRPPVPE